jgi:hypothetical protein
MATSGSAQAQVPAGPFAAQARSLHLSSAQAAGLQARIDEKLSRFGGTQASINKITYSDGGRLILALPGEARARDITDPADTAPASAPNFCYLGYFCGYSKKNFYGDKWDRGACGYLLNIPFENNHGSWANNQSKKTRAFMYNEHQDLIYTTPGAYSEDRDGDWRPVEWVMPCSEPGT